MTKDGIVCPCCGEVFHDEDMNKSPKDYWTCSLCGVIQHKKCRHLPDDYELKAHYISKRLSEEEMINLIRKEWNLMPLTIYIDVRFSAGIKKLSIRDIAHALYQAGEKK